ncbi:MAG: efflux RND transporter periplasmic adaptor subunit, partial [Proteobacteria bacterium]|nr:efflux RND transporter periplasmic adaptor subunit [Pseudomonadota bacterium]
LAISAVALTLVKAGHELAHAYTAKKQGLNIPVMGIALILFWPVLYTDTTDAWRLKKKKDRIHIGIAGVAFEIAIAILATLFWHIVPPGPMKSILFVLAATNWISTLAINLNPFMRFDGYYILSDFLDIPNLQPRSFALARWFLRWLILGVRQPCPEIFSLRKKIIMLVYAFSTWVYRFFLYSGVALLVYHLFFKLLGIVFFIFEIYLLFLNPLLKELKIWSTLRSSIKVNVHMILSLTVFSTIVLFLLYPWNSSGSMPGIYKATDFSRIFASASGQIKAVNIQNGQEVKKGDILFVLYSPQVAFQKEQALLQVHQFQQQLNRISFAKDQADLLHVVEQQLVEAMTRLDGAIEKENQLKIISPISGRVFNLAEALVLGRWVNESDQLALIVNFENMIVEGYIQESDRYRIQEFGRGVFYPADTEEKKIHVLIESISLSHSTVLDELYMASTYGGSLPVREDADGSLILQKTYYKVKMKPVQVFSVGSRIQSGTIKFQGEKVSYAARLWQGIQSVLIRESGF